MKVITFRHEQKLLFCDILQRPVRGKAELGPCALALLLTDGRAPGLGFPIFKYVKVDDSLSWSFFVN